MNAWELVVSFIAGLIVNEMTDVSPWVARKLVRWAAYRWTADPDMAAGYAEEWAAIIEERPGKLFKLFTAMQFSIGAAGRAAPRTLATIRENADRYLLAAGVPRTGLWRWLYVAILCAGFLIIVVFTVSLIANQSLPVDPIPVVGIFGLLSQVLWRLARGPERQRRGTRSPEKPSD